MQNAETLQERTLTTVPADVVRLVSDYLPAWYYRRLRISGRPLWLILNSKTMFARFTTGYMDLFALDADFALDMIRANNDFGWVWQFSFEPTDSKEDDLPQGHHRHRNLRYWTLRAAEAGDTVMLDHCFQSLKNLRSLAVPDAISKEGEAGEEGGGDDFGGLAEELLFSVLNRLVAGAHGQLLFRCMDNLFDMYRAMDMMVGDRERLDPWRMGVHSMVHQRWITGHSRSLEFAKAAVDAHAAGHRNLAISIVRVALRTFYGWTGLRLHNFLRTIGLTNDAHLITETVRFAQLEPLSEVYESEGIEWEELSEDEENSGVVGLIGIELFTRDDPRLATHLLPRLCDGIAPADTVNNRCFVIEVAAVYAMAANALSRGFVKTGRLMVTTIIENAFKHPLLVGMNVRAICDPMMAAMQYLSMAPAEDANRAEVKVRTMIGFLGLRHSFVDDW